MNFLQGLSRPLRLAGVVLLGVALVALVIGTITALNGPSTQNTAAPASSSAPSGAPGGGSTVPSPTSAPAAASSSSSSAPAATTPSSGAPVVGQPNTGTATDQAEAKWVQVRVYNNSTITGLAGRAASDLRADGWNVAEASNYPYGVIPTTTAYFTPGTDEETAAKALAAAFGMKAEPRFAGIQNASAGVIIIVTNDYQGLHSKGS
ncbi:LytR C-terminal domain-containing protein [Amycolatopsis cynarae]|uniref:LytR C-terminal domain-containing protein n=1 Tax=Amycolatopsis cynarae TaxID=2995223 RepID=A0ABY7B1R6_9PSEU|nr:LytR C-terminal domain-containing protein [Amycolatopsis sp. HUAS 11-8]WAL66242.1 LytR C-terminal domain-containing protein [Amycolatopsis sp. HUAS 11-8]